MRSRVGAWSLVMLLAVLIGGVACGSSGGTGGGSGGGQPQLVITEPANGANVAVPFALKFTSSVQLGPTDSGRDHVHVFADGKTNEYTVVPTTTFELKDLSPGQHTIGVTLQHASSQKMPAGYGRAGWTAPNATAAPAGSRAPNA